MVKCMRIIICDNDVGFTTQLHKYIFRYFEKNKLKPPKIDIFYSGDRLLEDKEKKDIIFLAIELPGVNGIVVARRLRKQNKDTLILIITAFIEYLDEAMRSNVFRYISKPLDKHRLYRNLSDAIYAYTHKSANITIKTDNGIKLISSNDISFVELINRKICIHTTQEDIYVFGTIKFWNEKLDLPCFYASHRSFIVNLSHITAISHEMITLDKGRHTAYLSKRKYTDIKKAWLLYLNGEQKNI